MKVVPFISRAQCTKRSPAERPRGMQAFGAIFQQTIVEHAAVDLRGGSTAGVETLAQQWQAITLKRALRCRKKDLTHARAAVGTIRHNAALLADAGLTDAADLIGGELPRALAECRMLRNCIFALQMALGMQPDNSKPAA